MSIQLINKYYLAVEKTKRFSGADNEEIITNDFADLIKAYCEKKNLHLIRQLTVKLDNGKSIRPDGTVRTSLRIDMGYWESKANVDLDNEIQKKIKAKYPLINTLFEDGKRALLYQKGELEFQCDISNPEGLDRLLTAFVSIETKAAKDFNEAIEHFKKDVPLIVKNLRDMIDEQQKSNPVFKESQKKFLEICRESINPEITPENINEMLIQHILTEEIFVSIFSDAQFHKENNIAKELYKVEETFFTGTTKYKTLNSIRGYYDMIKAQAGQYTDHHSKQDFLKVMYEQFYKAYNPKGADKLGIVYTPNEIVKFMIESTIYLLGKHFDKNLSDKNVEILDPATGTGTYITELIENYIPVKDLQYKYLNEIHANEISILPYYIANLNIEYIYQQKMNAYLPYPNICFVDTLDNLNFAGQKGQSSMSFGLGVENAQRIKRQNQRKISVVIGNPPYNANQMNENDNNKNRQYFADMARQNGGIDGRIKETFIALSTAQKTKVYDMYARFYRWAMDRVEKEGIIAFITNRSFIDSRTFDGFRKSVQDEFDHCYIYDTRSDVRANPKISGTGHNVFGIQTGVAMMFLVRKKSEKKKPCEIFYYTLEDEQTKSEKLDMIRQTKIEEIDFQTIRPDKNNNWINLADNDFESLIPVCSKEVKAANKNSKSQDQAIFKLFSLGVVTNRDEWVYDFDLKNLENKVKFLISGYNKDLIRLKGIKRADVKDNVNYSIKWTRAVMNDLVKGKKYGYDKTALTRTIYRPFVKQYLYFSKELNEMQYQTPLLFGEKNNLKNIGFGYIGMDTQKPFSVLGLNTLVGLNFLSPASGSQCFCLYKYDSKGNRFDNITDWALEQFCKHYKAKPAISKVSGATTSDQAATSHEDVGKGYKDYEQPHLDSNESQMLHEPEEDMEYGFVISKEDIFHYTYAVLHNPAYRKKYELNLKREFPRLPFYKDFDQWAAWGKALMDLHIEYEHVNPYPLKRENKTIPKNEKETIKAKLKADKEPGTIEIDEITTLTGIPGDAWQYKLGNRSALEWVLDQYKEYKPSDPTIAEKFNTYRFADYKEQVIDLLMRVTTVSVETMKIIKEMENESGTK
jgi:predicted helicase